MSRIKYLLHPIIFSLYPLLYLYSENISDIDISELIIPLSISVFIPLVVFTIIRLLLKDINRTSVITSFFIIVVFYCNYFYKLAADWSDVNMVGVAWGGLIFFCIFVFVIVRSNKDLSVYNIFLNVIAASFLIVPVYQICVQAYNSYMTINHNGEIKNQIHNGYVNNSETKRDVYYLIFDQYSRDDILLKYYKHDNSYFTAYLRNKGFYVADKAYANYPHTLQSLSSSLNMKYINYLSASESTERNDPSTLIRLIHDNKVIKYFKSKNYKCVHFGSEHQATKKNLNADINYNSYSFKNNQSTILNTIYKQSIISPIIKQVLNKDIVEGSIVSESRQLKHEGIIYQLSKMEEIANDPHATFVFMHLLIPHSPYVFDENGNYVEFEEENSNSVQVNYIRQLKYLNNRLMHIIDSILAVSNPQPVIIIQSDEGHYPPGYSYREADLNQYSNDELRHKFAILNAYYMPGMSTEQLYPEMTPVNTFKLLFNLYFDKNYKLLENRHFNTNYYKYYKFLDVTEKMLN